jgi:hypothetical protein
LVWKYTIWQPWLLLDILHLIKNIQCFWLCLNCAKLKWALKF